MSEGLLIFLFDHSLPVEYCGEKRYYECLDAVAEPANKATIMVSHEMIKSLHARSYLHETSSLKLLQDNIFTMLVVISFKLDCPFFETFNEKIDQMLSAGLFSYWERSADIPDEAKRASIEIGNEVLTLDHLWIGFQVFFVCLTSSVVVFVLELLVAFVTIIVSRIQKEKTKKTIKRRRQSKRQKEANRTILGFKS